MVKFDSLPIEITGRSEIIGTGNGTEMGTEMGMGIGMGFGNDLVTDRGRRLDNEIGGKRGRRGRGLD